MSDACPHLRCALRIWAQPLQFRHRPKNITKITYYLSSNSCERLFDAQHSFCLTHETLYLKQYQAIQPIASGALVCAIEVLQIRVINSLSDCKHYSYHMYTYTMYILPESM